MSAKKALQGSKTETRELLGGTEDNRVFSRRGVFLYKKETEKIEFMTRPRWPRGQGRGRAVGIKAGIRGSGETSATVRHQ